MGRYALLVATGEYQDVGLSRLRAPAQDVERLAALLEDPDVGGFTEVKVLRDAADVEVRRAVEDVLAARSPDDLVLVYFSCHGLTTPTRRLYFAAANTVRDRPAGTAVPRSFVHEQLEDCRAAGRVLVLDCCFSGAFVEGFKAGDAPVVDNSTGYVVLTASNAYEYAFEEDTLSLEAPRASLFTDVLIEGLSSGSADLDGDGWVDVNELFAYASREVRRRRPDQTPQFFAQASGGALRLARAGGVPAVVRQSASYTSGQLLVARGLRAAAEPVCRTLGPLGRRAVVFVGGRPVELGDAAAIAAAFQPDDPRDSLGASYVRELVSAVHRECGDGAASAVAVARGVVTRLVEAMREGHNPVRLLRGVRAAAARALELVGDLAVPLAHADAHRLATTSAGSEVIGSLVGHVVGVTGHRGAVLVEEGRRPGSDYEITRGLRFPGGYASELFTTDPVRREVVLENAQVALFSGPLTERVLHLVSDSEADGDLVILCEGLPESLLSTLLRRSDEKSRVVVVLAEPVAVRRLHAVVGGVVLDADIAAAATVRAFGRAVKVVATDRDTVVMGTGARSAEVVGTVEGDDAGAYLRVPAAHVGQVERAVRAVRSAAECGVLRGGGAGLAEIGRRLAEEPAGDPAHVAGWRALAGALAEPARWIAENAAVAVGELDPSLIDSAGTARAVVTAAARTAERFLLVA
ncbi:TCP-1/cpn60 chaperonin family protein [Actinosynnema sp. NPDC050436]|uniref:caspase, EACC1-associated type n=1 Tax=Actinosynnema sp. NPDC050436 TaxID=3155659 RepID=UPI0033DCEF0F